MDKIKLLEREIGKPKDCIFLIDFKVEYPTTGLHKDQFVITLNWDRHESSNLSPNIPEAMKYIKKLLTILKEG